MKSIASLERDVFDDGILLHERIDTMSANKMMSLLHACVGQQQLLVYALAQSYDELLERARELDTDCTKCASLYKTLVAALGTHEAILGYPIHRQHGDANYHYRICNTVFLVAARSLMCSLLLRPQEVAQKLMARASINIEYCMENNLCMSNQPILSYKYDEFVESMMCLSLRWPMLMHHPLLETYLQLLIIRFGMFATNVYTEEVANHEKFRLPTTAKLVRNDETLVASAAAPRTGYIANGLFCEYAAAILGGMAKEIALFDMFEIEYELPVDPEFMCVVRRWFDDAPERLALTESSGFMREMYSQFAVEPGQMDVFHIEYGNRQPPLHSVITKYRCRSVQTSLADATLSPVRLAKKLREQQQLDESKSLLAQLLYLSCVNSGVEQFAKPTRASAVVVKTNAELLRRSDELCTSELAYMVRVFHQFQVIHRGKMYITNSIRGAFAVWLHFAQSEERFAELCDHVKGWGAAQQSTPKRRAVNVAQSESLDPIMARCLDAVK